MLTLRPAALLLCAAALASCGDDAVQDITGALPAARVKFFNFGTNTPGVNFYANDRKMTAVQSTTGVESTTGTNPGQAGAAGLYVGIDPGQYTLSGRIAAATDKDLPVATAATTIADGKAYSFYISGIYDAATKKADAFVIEDPIPDPIDPASTYVRFVNAIPNSQPMILYLRNPVNGGEAPIGGATAYKGATAFVKFTGSGVIDFSARAPGGTTDLISRPGVSIVAGRVYTITARGDMTVTSTTSASRPQLDATANR
jgi:hypothetical protein